MSDDILSLYAYYPSKLLLKSILARKQMHVTTDGRGTIITWGPCIMLGGECSDAMLETLCALFDDSRNERYIYAPDAGWIQRMARTTPSHFKEKQLNIYVARAASGDARRAEDCIVPVDANFFGHGYADMSHVTDQLYSYLSREDYLQTGFGVALVKDNAIRGYCLSEYSIDAECGVNVWVDDKYRGLGYAKAMTQAFLEAGERGQWTMYWGCSSDNIASNHVARSCGFTPYAIQPYWLWQGSQPT